MLHGSHSADSTCNLMQFHDLYVKWKTCLQECFTKAVYPAVHRKGSKHQPTSEATSAATPSDHSRVISSKDPYSLSETNQTQGCKEHPRLFGA